MIRSDSEEDYPALNDVEFIIDEKGYQLSRTYIFPIFETFTTLISIQIHLL